jgi:hypothetical protein
VAARPAGRWGQQITETGAVPMEQWTLTATLGYTVTASVGTLENDDPGELFATTAAGFRPEPGLTP